MHRLAILTLLSVVLTACTGHAIPPVAGYPRATDAAQVRAFVDMNGSFYPAYWENSVTRKALKKHDSLLQAAAKADEAADAAKTAEAMRGGLFDAIQTGRVDQLRDIRRLAAEKDRVFILVHGFNNLASETSVPFDMIERELKPTPNDLVIRFNWDGLTATGIGGARIWFFAVANSKLAGTRGLRRILNQIEDKPVYLITHSRGASVALSALSDPYFEDDFRHDTAKVTDQWPDHYPDLFKPDGLQENGNSLYLLMMAPAIGHVDFCPVGQPDCTWTAPMTTQLCSLRYTVNPGDPVLRKFLGLADKLNPTDFGTDHEVGRRLSQMGAAYLRQVQFAEAMKKHGFGKYVEHPTFKPMLDGMLAEPRCN